jgi:hypothetical protein
MKIYFAHPVAHYNTDMETMCLRSIREAFPDAHIINPNGEGHTIAYKQYGMNYFKGIVSNCDAVAYAPFSDGEVGMGVFTEIMTMVDMNGKIFKATPNQVVEVSVNEVYGIRPLSILETRERTKKNLT